MKNPSLSLLRARAESRPVVAASRGRRAFTLLEVIVVIGMLAVLLTAVISSLQGTSQAGRVETVKLYFNTTADSALAAYHMNVGRYPTTEQGLMALREAPAGLGAGQWRGPYLKDDPVDPWGAPYRYRFPGTHNPGRYDIWSIGPDGVDENGGGDDIPNWKTAQ